MITAPQCWVAGALRLRRRRAALIGDQADPEGIPDRCFVSDDLRAGDRRRFSRL